MLSTFVKPMHPEGHKFVSIFAAITLVPVFVVGTFGLGLAWV
jgi:phosphatidylserine decarboxylase